LPIHRRRGDRRGDRPLASGNSQWQGTSPDGANRDHHDLPADGHEAGDRPDFESRGFSGSDKEPYGSVLTDCNRAAIINCTRKVLGRYRG
jgi:hypothetical protein